LQFRGKRKNEGTHRTPLCGFGRFRARERRKNVTRGENVVRLPPFYFGQTQDRGNGKNLCRSHPKLSARLVPLKSVVQVRSSDSGRESCVSGKSTSKLRYFPVGVRFLRGLR
jgi:hypothetical protein